jgi:hypothetical protein
MPQPIDIHTEIARVDATTRVQQVADRAALTAQHRFSLEAEERRTETETNVVEKDAIDGEHMDSEHRRRAQYAKRQREKQKAQGDEEPSDDGRMALPNSDEGTQLDVSI